MTDSEDHPCLKDDMIWFFSAVAVAVVVGYLWAKSRKNRTAVQSTTPLRVTRGTSRSARDEMWLPIVGTSYHSAIDYAGDGPVEVRLKREPNNVCLLYTSRCV